MAHKRIVNDVIIGGEEMDSNDDYYERLKAARKPSLRASEILSRFDAATGGVRSSQVIIIYREKLFIYLQRLKSKQIVRKERKRVEVETEKIVKEKMKMKKL